LEETVKRRTLTLAVVIALSVTLGATTALALIEPGGFDPGPYSACVESKSGDVRMVDGEEACNSKEYGIGWANGFSIWDYSNTNFFGEHATATTWFHQLACPEGTEPLGGGGAFLPDEDPDVPAMALQSSVPTTDEDLGGLHGWEVLFVSVDGEPHTGTFQVFATCAPATFVE
jgi:hypothetical protein